MAQQSSPWRRLQDAQMLNQDVSKIEVRTVCQRHVIFAKNDSEKDMGCVAKFAKLSGARPSGWSLPRHVPGGKAKKTDHTVHAVKVCKQVESSRHEMTRKWCGGTCLQVL